MEIISLIGQLDGMMFAFALIFILLDVVSGYAQAVANKCISSQKMKSGFWHKLALVLAMLAAGLADMVAAMEIDLGFSMPIFEASCIYVMIMELTSIIENLELMNPQIAESRLGKLFAQVVDSEKVGQHGSNE